MTRFKKADIKFHSEGYGRNMRPAVNVKVYDTLTDHLVERVKDEQGLPSAFSLEWIDEHLTDDARSDWFNIACTDGWEMLTELAREIWHHNPRIEVYSVGRSGGWAVVEGISKCVEDWDAIDVARWGRFAKLARELADGIMYQVVDLIAVNEFMPWLEHGMAVAETV